MSDRMFWKTQTFAITNDRASCRRAISRVPDPLRVPTREIGKLQSSQNEFKLPGARSRSLCLCDQQRTSRTSAERCMQQQVEELWHHHQFDLTISTL